MGPHGDVRPADQPIGPAWTNCSNALGPAEGDNGHVVSLGDLDQAQIDAGGSPGRITLEFRSAHCRPGGAGLRGFRERICLAIRARNGFRRAGLRGRVERRHELSRVFRAVSLQTLETINTNLPVGAWRRTSMRVRSTIWRASTSTTATPGGRRFDLRDLRWHPSVVGGQVDLSGIRFVRLVDIPGSGDFQDHSLPAPPVFDGWVT